jgi:hypothetical protein
VLREDGSNMGGVCQCVLASLAVTSSSARSSRHGLRPTSHLAEANGFLVSCMIRLRFSFSFCETHDPAKLGCKYQRVTESSSSTIGNADLVLTLIGKSIPSYRYCNPRLSFRVLPSFCRVFIVLVRPISKRNSETPFVSYDKLPFE